MYLIYKMLLGVIMKVKSECRMAQLLWKTAWYLLKMLNIELQDSAIPLQLYTQEN